MFTEEGTCAVRLCGADEVMAVGVFAGDTREESAGGYVSAVGDYFSDLCTKIVLRFHTDLNVFVSCLYELQDIAKSCAQFFILLSG